MMPRRFSSPVFLLAAFASAALSVWVPETVSAQRMRFDRYSAEQGLSQSSITALLRDRTGFLWVGTTDGLNRFDGYNFTVFSAGSLGGSAGGGLPGNAITALCEDTSRTAVSSLWGQTTYRSGNTLWIGTTNGLARTTDGGTTFQVVSVSGSVDTVLALCKDRRGRLWVGAGTGLYQSTDGGASFTALKFDVAPTASKSDASKSDAPKPNTSLSGASKGALQPDSRITALCEDTLGGIWIGTANGLYMTADSGASFTRYKSAGDDAVTALHSDAFGNVWAGTVRGAFKLNPVSKALLARYLTENSVTSLSEDARGIVWIGTRGAGLHGFYRARGTNDAFNRNRFEPPDLRNTDVSAVLGDAAGNLWIGTNGNGVFHRPAVFTSGQFEFFAVNNVSKGGRADVAGIIEDRATADGNNLSLFVGKRGAGIWGWIRANGINSGDMTLAAAAAKTAALPTDAQSPAPPKPRSAKSAKPSQKKRGRGKPAKSAATKAAASPETSLNLGALDVSAVFQSSTGDLWLGTNGDGLHCLGADGITRTFRRTDGNPQSLSDDRITALCEAKDGTLWVGTKSGLNKAAPSDKASGRDRSDIFTVYSADPPAAGKLSHNAVTALCIDGGVLWVGTSGGGLCKSTDGGATFLPFKAAQGNAALTSNRITALLATPRALWVGTDAGLCMTTDGGASFTALRVRNGLPSDFICGILEDGEQNVWLSTKSGISKLSPARSKAAASTAVLNTTLNGASAAAPAVYSIRNYDVPNNTQVAPNEKFQYGNEFNVGAAHRGRSGIFYFGGRGWVTFFHPDSIQETKSSGAAPVVVTALGKTSGKTLVYDYSVSMQNEAHFSYHEYPFTLSYASLAFQPEDRTQYAYQLSLSETPTDDWKEVGTRREITYPSVTPNTYHFFVRATSRNGERLSAPLKLIIDPPLWQRWWFIMLMTGAFVGLGYTGYKQRIKTIEARNRELEAEVVKRTVEIEQQKEELADINRSLTSSISYAQTIQQAILPDREAMKACLPEHFVLYKPKDIVSGDFYWFYDAGDALILAVGDCTGHGVPGAFMSVIGDSLLAQIVVEKQLTAPHRILGELHKGVRRALNQTDDLESSQDGMDISICRIEKKTVMGSVRLVQYAGAKRPLYYIDGGSQSGGGDFSEIKGDKFSIGGWHHEAERNFTLHELHCRKGSMLYFTTDGYADQPDRESRVFAAKRLREMLKSIAGKSVAAQQDFLEKELSAHQGNEPQRDDITVVGVRITA